MEYINNNTYGIHLLFIPSDFICVFPENLRGQFISAHKGFLTFNATTITGYTTTVPNLPVVSWECQIKEGNKYKLQAIESTATFGGTLFLHLCLEIHAVSENKFYYYLGTNRHSFAQDYVEGVIATDATTALNDVDNSCNRAEPYNPGSYILLVKDGSVESGNATIQCPTDLLAVFSGVNITNSAGTKEYCEDTTLDVCNDRTMLNYTYNDTCSTVKTYSAGGVYSCVYAIEDSGTTYLGVWNNDTTVDDSTTFRFTCYAFQKSGGIVYATEAPRFCNDSDQTSTAVGSINGGNIIELYNIIQTCLDVESTTTTSPTTTVAPEEVVPASLDLLALLPLILLIPLFILLFFLIKRYVIPKIKARKKEVVITELRKLIVSLSASVVL
ncbi:hypothetical protein KUTeg_024819 [Tegillarca granosa]|uniref:DUF7042 domain-containing protein n=1 Tax=Tegillarca granosa TaxID=220873 RepID=A0ABQ9E4Q2_TEGGR|nr:hypothetical protein KUTeg_024819 [Tegillarca granosa]